MKNENTLRVKRPKKTLVSAKILAETKERLAMIIANSSHANTPTIYELLDEGSIAVAKKRGVAK